MFDHTRGKWVRAKITYDYKSGDATATVISVLDENQRQAQIKEMDVLRRQRKGRKNIRKDPCGTVYWPKGWTRILTLGFHRWHGVPWVLRKPRFKLGRKFPWIMQPTAIGKGCGCPIKTKAAAMAIKMAYRSFIGVPKTIVHGIRMVINA